MKKIFSEERAYELIDVVYKDRESFRRIARDAVKKRIDRGREIDEDFFTHVT